VLTKSVKQSVLLALMQSMSLTSTVSQVWNLEDGLLFGRVVCYLVMGTGMVETWVNRNAENWPMG
jgi:hypothetical protein